MPLIPIALVLWSEGSIRAGPSLLRVRGYFSIFLPKDLNTTASFILVSASVVVPGNVFPVTGAFIAMEALVVVGTRPT